MESFYPSVAKWLVILISSFQGFSWMESYNGTGNVILASAAEFFRI